MYQIPGHFLSFIPGYENGAYRSFCSSMQQCVSARY
jgi:hypothetical protein